MRLLSTTKAKLNPRTKWANLAVLGQLACPLAERHSATRWPQRAVRRSQAARHPASAATLRSYEHASEQSVGT